MSWRIAVDIGGTFTDIVALEESSGTLHLAKGTEHAGRSRQWIHQRHRAHHRKGGYSPGGHRRRLPRNDRRHQRHPAAQVFSTRIDHHQRVPRSTGGRAADGTG